MILRIEDGSNPIGGEDAIENLVQALDWGGVACDEGVYLTAEERWSKEENTDRIFNLNGCRFTKNIFKNCWIKGCLPLFCSKERLDTLRAAQSEQNQTPRYDKKCLALTEEKFEAKIEGRRRVRCTPKLAGGYTD